MCSNHTAPSGVAVVTLRDKRQYEGPVQIAAGFVHSQGRRRVVSAGEVTYRNAMPHSWPPQRVLEIRWLADREGA